MNECYDWYLFLIIFLQAILELLLNVVNADTLKHFWEEMYKISLLCHRGYVE